MSEQPTCGTCRFFEVRNAAEADLARIAKNESECQPGEWVFRGERKVGCHGGAVRGSCMKWEEVPLPSPQVDSTFGCRLYQAGGPVIRGAAAMKSAMELTGAANRPPSTSVSTKAYLMTLLGVGLVGVASQVLGGTSKAVRPARARSAWNDFEDAPAWEDDGDVEGW